MEIHHFHFTLPQIKSQQTRQRLAALHLLQVAQPQLESRTHWQNIRRRARRSEASSLRVVVFDAVDVVLHVHGERHSIQTLFTHYAAETAGMVGLSESLEDLEDHEQDSE